MGGPDTVQALFWRGLAKPQGVHRCVRQRPERDRRTDWTNKNGLAILALSR